MQRIEKYSQKVDGEERDPHKKSMERIERYSQKVYNENRETLTKIRWRE
jgi:hypothetical protein